MGYLLSTNTTHDFINRGNRCESKLFCLQILPPTSFHFFLFVSLLLFSCSIWVTSVVAKMAPLIYLTDPQLILRYSSSLCMLTLLAMSFATAVVLRVPSPINWYIYEFYVNLYQMTGVLWCTAVPKFNHTDICSLSFLFSRMRTGIGNTAAYVTSF